MSTVHCPCGWTATARHLPDKITFTTQGVAPCTHPEGDPLGMNCPQWERALSRYIGETARPTRSGARRA